MTKPSGLMSLLPPIKDPVEDEEQAKAHAIVMQRINAASAALPAARIADQPLVSFTPEFYKKFLVEFFFFTNSKGPLFFINITNC